LGSERLREEQFSAVERLREEQFGAPWRLTWLAGHRF
jgi:hypothetical protein